jgi:hypothetical protein
VGCGSPARRRGSTRKIDRARDQRSRAGRRGIRAPIDIDNTQTTLAFVQFLRARNDRIVHVREYFSAPMRAEL